MVVIHFRLDTLQPGDTNQEKVQPFRNDHLKRQLLQYAKAKTHSGHFDGVASLDNL